MEKYFNDAIVGNKNMLASFTKKGELIRLLYPSMDYRQFIDFFHVGIKINDSALIYLHDDINNVYNQKYIEDTNILKTEIINTYFKIDIIQTDFVCVNKNSLIKKYKFINKNNINLNVNFAIHSSLVTNQNNQVTGYYRENSLIQYMHDYTFSIVSKNKVLGSQINNNSQTISEGIIGDKDYIGMSSDSSICYEIGELQPGEEKEIDILICINNTSDIKNIETEIENASKTDIKKELEIAKKHWRKYLREHDTVGLPTHNSEYMDLLNKIYKRSILLFPLLTNIETGGISAAVEIDENKTQCGRYSFCWPRDGIFITNALDILNMKKESEKFYKNFCKITQSKNGRWEQRFYTDGNLAPCWGYQIDETASVVYGIYNHYKRTKNIKFLKDTLKMCEMATKYLKKYINNILENIEEEYKSYDIWEENEGIHTYSLTAIFSAFQAMIEINKLIIPEFQENRLKIEKINKENLELEKYIVDIKDYILKNLYDNDKKTFVRNKDRKIDISLLGLVTPFEMFAPKEKKILNTVEKIDLTLRTYTGGYLRYEGDNYAGGNPWVIANLWMAKYYLKQGSKKKAKECFEFVVKTATELGFLGEQIDNKTMKANWVIGLGWSHAMFIDVLKELYS